MKFQGAAASECSLSEQARGDAMQRDGATAADVAAAFENMKQAYLALMEQEGVEDPRELMKVTAVTPAHRKASHAAERFLKMFAAYEPDVAVAHGKGLDS